MTQFNMVTCEQRL